MAELMRTFPTGATRDDDTHKPDYRKLLSLPAIKRFGEYMVTHSQTAEGSRSLDNWKKGIPKDVYLASLVRHVVDLALVDEVGGYTEDLTCAVLFNVQGYLHELVKDRAEIHSYRRDPGTGLPVYISPPPDFIRASK